MCIAYHSDRVCRSVALQPFDSKANAFIWLTKQSLKEAGCTITPLSFSDSCKSHEVARFVILNWYDEIIGDASSAILQYIKRRIVLCGFIRRHSKIICVIHNKAPHDGVTRVSSILSKRLRRYLCKHSEAIVGLCNATLSTLQSDLPTGMANDIKKKFHVVPHPSYDSYYRSVMSNDLSAESAGVATQLSFTFLFIGQIRPYKNVELVLNTARKFEQAGIDASFIIAGRCQDKPYLSTLYEAAPSNVHIREGFIPDDEIPSLIESSNALILPYDTRSSLNSGTCMLAFTFGRTVVCPSIGTLEGTPDELIYKYSYASMSEHEDRLFAKALEAYEDWHGDHDAFMKKGAQLQKATITHNSVKDIAESWNAVFEAIELDER